MSPDPTAGPRPSAAPVLVDIPAGGASAAELIGAVDAALGGDLPAVRVRVLIAPDDPARATLAALTEADRRVSLTVPGAAAEQPAALRFVLPPAARPAAHALPALAEILAAGDAAAVEVAVPRLPGPLGGRLAAAARLPGARRLRGERSGGQGRTVRVTARSVGLGSFGAPFSGPPPQRDLAAERVEHLRHRARSATLRARFERDSQRLTREAMRAEHERVRALVMERRLAATSPWRRIAWMVRVAGRTVVAAGRRIWWWGVVVRALAARAVRLARVRLRERPGPEPPS